MTKHRSTVIIPDYKTRGGYKLADISKQVRFVIRLAVACHDAGCAYGMKWELSAGRMLATITAEGDIPTAKPLAKEKVTRVPAAWKPAIWDAECRAAAFCGGGEQMKPGFVIEHSSGLSIVHPGDGSEIGVNADGTESGDIRKNWILVHSASGRTFGLDLSFTRAAAALLMAAELFDGWHLSIDQLADNRDCRIAAITTRAKYDKHFDLERELARVPAATPEVVEVVEVAEVVAIAEPVAAEAMAIGQAAIRVCANEKCGAEFHSHVTKCAFCGLPTALESTTHQPIPAISAEGPVSVPFGRIYGDPSSPAYITPHGPVWMWRKSQRVRFFTADGYQVGPEQRNVAPAVFAAMAAGWIDPDILRMRPNADHTEAAHGNPHLIRAGPHLTDA